MDYLKAVCDRGLNESITAKIIALGVLLNGVWTAYPAKTIPYLGDFAPVHLLFFDITGDLADYLRDGLAGVPRNGQGHRTE